MGSVLQAEEGPMPSPKEGWVDACVLSYRETSVAGEQGGKGTASCEAEKQAVAWILIQE